MKVINGYTLQKELGEGSFGQVFLAQKGEKKFAIKAYNHKKVDRNLNSDKLKEMIDTEIKFLINFDHPNIIKVHETFLSENHVYLVMDYIPGGDLIDKIIKSGFLLSEAEAVILLKDITKAMFFATQEGVRHRDIKPENILILGDHFILADFGVSNITCTFSSTAVGTRPYMPPQILLSETYTSKCDVWSLGITVYILLFGKDPFGRYEIRDKGLRQIRDFKLEKRYCGSSISFPSSPSISAGVKKIIQKMLEYDEADRVNWIQLKLDLQNLTGDFNSKPTIITEIISRRLVQETEAAYNVNATLSSDNETPDFLRIMQTASSLKDSCDDIPASDIISITRIGYSPESEEDVESIERFLLLKLRLCQLFLSLIFQIKEVIAYPGLEDFRGWLSAASALMCKKLTEVCEYCFGKLSSKHKFTNFTSSKFHQNGFAKQFYHDFYTLNINTGPLQDEAIEIAKSQINDKIEEKCIIIEVASSKCFHAHYQNIYNLVAYYCIKKLEIFREGNKLSEINVAHLEQNIGWIYFVGIYDDQLLNRAKTEGSEDGFHSLIKSCEDKKYIRETYEQAKKHYKHFFEQ